MNLFRTFFLVTNVVANVLWVVALIAQGVTAKFGRNTVGILWFAIVLQLLVNIGSLCTLLNRSADLCRSQLSHFAVLSVAFAGIGIDANIYSEQAIRQLVGASWLVLAVVDMLWIVYFSADPQSRIWKLFHLESAVTPANEKDDMEPNPASPSPEFLQSTNPPLVATDNRKSSTVDGTETYTLTSTQPTIKLTDETGLSSQGSFSYRARALYDYSAPSSTASNELNFNQLSFKKGDILEVSRTLDKKWWPAKAQDGKRGIAPSNYLEIITEASTE